jgi:hypothetical protein
MISEAFDTLYDTTTQEAYLLTLSQPKRSNKTFRTPGRTPPKKPGKKAWWQKRSMDEILKDLRRREEEEKILRQQFTTTMRSRFVSRRISRDLQAVSQLCEDLDREIGRTESTLWPLTEEKYVEGEKTLEGLIGHLRCEHLYCFYCGVRFTDFDDMAESCPGPAHEDHS